MRLKTTVLIVVFCLCGCSSMGDGIIPEDTSNLPVAYRLPQAARWTWDMGLYRVSEDHTSIEALPDRGADWHVNVNTFVEPPHCDSCLMIGKPDIQGDGTLKVKVILSHPFPGSPEYTGFDVKGTIMFPATRYWTMHWHMYNWNFELIFPDKEVPLFFSRAEDGGGQLLNADGFSFYLWPGLDLGCELPIMNYSKGKYAAGPDPDSTINGFKLFTKDPERRMFRVTDTIMRTYHIAPPEGEFIFGYVVDASWVQPSVTPVTDPAADFPFWANCEEPYVIGFEQLAPLQTGDYSLPGAPDPYDLTKVTVLTHQEVDVGDIQTTLFCADIKPGSPPDNPGITTTILFEEEGPGVYSVTHGIGYSGQYEAPPGQYFALVFGEISYWEPFQYPGSLQIIHPPFADFINLEVVEGDW